MRSRVNPSRVWEGRDTSSTALRGCCVQAMHSGCSASTVYPATLGTLGASSKAVNQTLHQADISMQRSTWARKAVAVLLGCCVQAMHSNCSASMVYPNKSGHAGRLFQGHKSDSAYSRTVLRVCLCMHNSGCSMWMYWQYTATARLVWCSLQPSADFMPPPSP